MKITFKLIAFAILFTLVSNSICASENTNKLLQSLKKTYAPDSRTSIFDLLAYDYNNKVVVRGKVDNKMLKQHILHTLNVKRIDYIDSITVLEYSHAKSWALIKLSIASLRTSGKHSAEMATQAIMGTPVKILEYAGEWVRVQTPDQYIAYVPGNSLHKITQTEFNKWRESTRFIVTVYQSQLIDNPNDKNTVSDLVLGNILEYKGESGEYIKLSTPDGREGFINKNEVQELRSWAEQPFNAQLINDVAHRMMGSSYLWGGTSTKVTDCSGLVKVSYFANGIILQRDASQQALTGKIINAEDWKEAQLGDLFFFGNKSGKVTHVGIYLKDGEYIHCSGRVKINSVDPKAKDYLTTPFLSISRINGMTGTNGITKVKEHIWYF